MLRALVLLASSALLLHAQDSLPAPGDDEVRAAIAEATKLLTTFQETYVESRPTPRRLPTETDKKQWEENAARAEAAKSTKAGPPSEWPYEGVYRVAGGLIPPGYRVGGTAIACWALLESPGFKTDAPRREVFFRGIAFVLDALEKHELLQSGFLGTYDVRGWAHAYALRTLLRCREAGVLPGEVAKRSEAMIKKMIKTLEDTEIPECGGWNYSRSGANKKCPPSTFMTAPTLQALFEARKQGFGVREDVIERGLKSLEDARLETGAFQYSTSAKKTGQGFEAVPGACARMAVSETTLFLAGRVPIERVREAVAAFFEHWQWLEKRRKQTGTHIPPYMIAPYYFHYAHTYVAQAIEQLPEAERPALRSRLRALYWKTREPDGGWNDRVFPRSEGYGTAMAILGLSMPQLPPPARFEPTKTKTTSKPVK